MNTSPMFFEADICMDKAFSPMREKYFEQSARTVNGVVADVDCTTIEDYNTAENSAKGN